MPKESNQPKSDSRALRRLDPYNTSPREEENPERSSRHSSGEKARSRPSQTPSRSETRSRSRSPSEPPQWARELLKNQEEYRKEMKRLQSEIERDRASMSTRDGRVSKHVFKYVGNKKLMGLLSETINFGRVWATYGCCFVYFLVNVTNQGGNGLLGAQ